MVNDSDFQYMVNELNSINSSRTRFYTTIFIDSSFYDLSFSLLYIEEFILSDGYLVLVLPNHSIRLKILEDTRLTYENNEPPVEDGRRKKKYR